MVGIVAVIAGAGIVAVYRVIGVIAVIVVGIAGTPSI
jgi:hypothetical protein